jgi:hypothetical protein
MLAVGLLLFSAAWVAAVESTRGGGSALHEKIFALGFSAERMEQVLDQCRKNGLSDVDAEALFGPVYTAHAESLPAELVLLKIEEGLAKKVDSARLSVAVQARLGFLRQANQLVSSGRGGPGSGGQQRIVARACMALESGLPIEVLQDVFGRKGGFRYGRMHHVIEAGEILHLAGLAPENIKQVMNECLERDLTGPEIQRVVDVILSGSKKGQSFERIHATLWVQGH